jgi:Flp pilus assembly protein TadD
LFAEDEVCDRATEPFRYSNVVPLVSEKLERSTTVASFLCKPGVMEVVVCAVTFLAYLSTLSFGFVYDDKPVITDNVAIRHWHSISYYFTPQPSVAASPSSGSFYRPVTLLWLRLNYAFFGLDPAGWHFAMVMCHVLMTYLVFVLVEKLSDNRTTAILAAILFGLHPVHVENVAWLSSVNDLLMSVFLVGSFVAYLNYRDGRKLKFWLPTSLILFSLALLSKETAAVFPFLIFFFAAIFDGRPGAEGRVWYVLKRGLVATPFFVVLVAFLVIRRMLLHVVAPPLTPLSWDTMLLTAPSVLWFDLKHLLFPISASEFYSLAYVTAPAFRSFVLPVFFLLGSLVAATLYISKWSCRNLGFFALGLMFIPILPTLYLRAIAPANFLHDRFLYFPSVGIVIFIALALEQIFSLKTEQIRGGAMMGAAVMILGTAALAGTIRHQIQWASNLLLYQNAIKYAPQNPVLQVNLGNEFAGLGHYDKALPLYLSALQNDPSSWLSNYNLGYAYYRTRRFLEAENCLKRAIQIDDRDPDQFIYLALIEMERGELAQAAQNAERAIQRGPTSPGFHFVLGKILEAGGDRNGAFGEYRAELVSHPDNELAKSEVQRLQSLK